MTRSNIQQKLRAAQVAAQKGVQRYMFERIKTVDADTLTLDQLVELSALALLLRDQYERHGVDAPDWLSTNSKVIHRAIRAKTADQLEKLLTEKKTKLEASLPAEERRDRLKNEIADLEKKLQATGA